MRGSTALLRAATAVAMSAALMLPFNTGAAAIGTTGLDLNKLRPELRNHVSGMVDQAISSRSSSGSSAILVNFFPRQDECNITRAGNVKVNQNCLNITDADLQGRGQAQNETTVAVDPTTRVTSSRASTTIEGVTAPAAPRTAWMAARRSTSRQCPTAFP